MNHTEKIVPVWKKYSLNVSEAAEYYGIGEKRLRQIAGENEGADCNKWRKYDGTGTG